MHRTVGELRSSLDTDDYIFWKAYYSLHGFPDQAILGTLARGMTLIANSLGAKIECRDLLVFDGKTEEQRYKERQALARAHFAALAATKSI